MKGNRLAPLIFFAVGFVFSLPLIARLVVPQSGYGPELMAIGALSWFAMAGFSLYWILRQKSSETAGNESNQAQETPLRAEFIVVIVLFFFVLALGIACGGVCLVTQ